ncbi:unnamed protein product, partial [Hapterophycus canaliculatus]
PATQSLSEDNVHDSQEITSASVSQVAGTSTTLVFTRPLDPTDDSKVTLSSEEGEEAIIIYAWGSSNELDYHGAGNRGSVTLSDLSCTEAEEDGTDDEGDSTDVDTAGESCASSDPDYEFEVELTSDLVLFWSV